LDRYDINATEPSSGNPDSVSSGATTSRMAARRTACTMLRPSTARRRGWCWGR